MLTRKKPKRLSGSRSVVPAADFARAPLLRARLARRSMALLRLRLPCSNRCFFALPGFAACIDPPHESRLFEQQAVRMLSCIRHVRLFIACCHDEIRASGSYRKIGVFRRAANQSFRKPGSSVCSSSLAIRNGRKYAPRNLLLLTETTHASAAKSPCLRKVRLISLATAQ